MNLEVIQKILEICQYSVIYFVLGFLSAYLIDSIFPEETKETLRKRNMCTLILLCVLQISLNGVILYFIEKIAGYIPFIFQLTPNYNHSLIESIGGVSMAISFTFEDLQTSLIWRIKEICSRLGICQKNHKLR